MAFENSMNPMMMNGLMGGGGGREQPGLVQGPNIGADYIMGMERAQEEHAQDQEAQERQLKIQADNMGLLKAQREQDYQKGMDALHSGDPEKARQFAKLNPGVWSQVEADAQAQSTAQGVKNAAYLKQKLTSMTWEQWQQPDTQDAVKKLMGTEPPKFKDANGFEEWRMEAAGLMDHMTGALGTKYKLQLMYAHTHDPNLKRIIDEQDQKDQTEYDTKRARLLKTVAEADKSLRPNLSFNDSFAGVLPLVHNDPVLKGLGADIPDPQDPSGKRMIMGPKSAATTQIANMARDIYYRDHNVGTADAEQRAVEIYKFRTTIPHDKQVETVRRLLASPKDKKLQDAFEEKFHFPASYILSQAGIK